MVVMIQFLALFFVFQDVLNTVKTYMDNDFKLLPLFLSIVLIAVLHAIFLGVVIVSLMGFF